jgi:hypothetical protein
MPTMTEPIGLAEGRPFTVHDLEAMPDDGWRHGLTEACYSVAPVSTRTLRSRSYDERSWWARW